MSPDGDQRRTQDGELRLDAYLPYRLSVASNAVSGLIARAYQDRFGLTVPQWRLICVLAEDGGLTQGQLVARTVIDLRSTEELARDGRYARAHEVEFHHVPVFEEDALPFVAATRDTPAPPPGEDYVAIATCGREAIANTIEVLAAADYAAVFHCAAGKDRTGIVAALLLSILGVWPWLSMRAR